MSNDLQQLLGEEIIEHNPSGIYLNEIKTSQINGKTIALYFAAHWCPPCRTFTPRLVEAFGNATIDVKNGFEIIFVSFDIDQRTFEEHFGEMPWKALRFSDQNRSNELEEKFIVQELPCLVVLSSSLEIITKDGVNEILVGFDKALHKWIQGEPLFWSCQPRPDEFVWNNVTCSKCFCSPLIELRYGSIDQENNINLCQTCFRNEQDRNIFIEYLVPKREYPSTRLLSSIPYLIRPKTNERIETKTLFTSDIKAIGFYFTAHWCPSCREFTPMLAELYNQLDVTDQSFQIIFISRDQNEESFNEYRSEMPWLSAPFRTSVILKEYFQLAGIPSLFIVSSDGRILSRRGTENVIRHRLNALKTWAQGEALKPPPLNQYEWTYVSCHGCQMTPLIGKRYTCTVCDNYNLCSACHETGHEHSLELQPFPNDQEDDE